MSQSPAGEQLPSASELPENLEPLWEQQRTSVRTAKIQFHRLHAASGFTNLNPADFIELCRNFQPGRDPHKAFRDVIVPAVFADLRDADYKWLRPARFLLSETRSRCDEWHGSLVIAPDSEVLVDGKNQIDIYLPGRSSRARTTLENFRILPPSTNNWKTLGKSATDASLHIASADESVRALIDSKTGDFLELVKEHEGNIESAVFQWGPVDYPNGARIPKCLIGAKFHPNGTLRFVHAVFVDQVEFDQPMSERVFLVSVKQGTTVVDYRAGEPSPDEFPKPPIYPMSGFSQGTLTMETISLTTRRLISRTAS